MDTSKSNDIEFASSPTGFSLYASLSRSYWSILVIIFLVVVTWVFASGLTKEWFETHSLFFVAIALIVTPIVGSLWWIVLLGVFGNQSVILDIHHLEIGVGLGPLRFRYHFDTREISSIVEGDGVLTGGEGVPPYKAVVLQFMQPVPGRIFNRKKFAFGHYLTKEQRQFIIDRLHEIIRTAA